MPECLATLDKIPPDGAALAARRPCCAAAFSIARPRPQRQAAGATAENRRPGKAKVRSGHRGLPPGPKPRHGQQPGDPPGDVPDRGSACWRWATSRGAAGAIRTATAKLFAEYPEGLAASLQKAELVAAVEARRRGPGRLPPRAGGRLRSRSISTIRGFRWTQLRCACWPLIAHTWTRRTSRWRCSSAGSSIRCCRGPQALELTAEVHSRWGQTLLDQAEHASPGKADWLRTWAGRQ